MCNPKYKGYYCGRKSSKIDYKLKTVKHFPEDEWVMYKDEENVPPIVSEELWDKANLILSKRSAKQSAEDKSGYQNRYPYSGKIICGVHKVPYYRSLYRYKSGNKEIWQCQEYSRKGREGCTSPIIYTSEADEILRQVLEELTVNKTEIIHELIRIYQSIGNGSRTEEDIARCRVEIDSVLKRKDKLLDLSIDGRISDDEFSQRNGRFNEEIDKLLARLAELEEEKLKNQDMLQSIDVLRQAITKELSFENGFSVGVVDALLDRMEVHPQKEGEKDVVHVSVYLKAIPEEEKYFCLFQTIHMMRAVIRTELSPIVGSERQSEELVQSLLADFADDPARLWQSNLFGKSLHQLVNEGLQAKLLHMPQEARTRMQETLERVINEGCTGLICILL